MTFREWLKEQSKGQFLHSQDARNAFMDALGEFDRRFTVATLEELAASMGTVWIEQNGEDDPE